MASIQVSAMSALNSSAATFVYAIGAANAYGKMSVGAANGIPFISAASALKPDGLTIASPALTGTPTAPTAANGTNTTQIATTAFVLANAGAGSIGGAFTAGQVAFCDAAANTIAGNDNFFWSNSRQNLSIGPGHSIVDSPYSFTAGGSNSVASGMQPAFAFGVTNQVLYAWACAIGYGNLVEYQACFAAGQANGVLGTSQCGIALGYSNTVNTGVIGSAAIGSQVALGANAIFGLGSSLTISGLGSFGLGTGLIVTGDHSGGINLDGTARTIANNNVFAILGGKVGIGSVAPEAPLHVRDSSILMQLLHGTTTFPFSTGARNALADDFLRIIYGTDGSRGGELTLSFKPSDGTSNSTPVAKVKWNSKGYMGLGVTSTIPEILTYKNKVTSANFTGSETCFIDYAVETIDTATENLFTRTLQDNFVYSFTFDIVVRRDDTGTENAVFTRRVVVYRNGGGAVLASNQTIGTDYALTIAATPTIGVTGDDFTIDVTGETGKTLAWYISGKYAVTSSAL